RTTAIERENPFHFLRLRRYVHHRLDEGVTIERQHWIPAALERDRARWLATEPGATDRSREMPWINLEIVRKSQQSVVNARKEPRGIFARATGQVWPTH